MSFLKRKLTLNKNLKSSQTLDDILSHQRSPLDKSDLGYAGESSSKNDNASNNKDVRKPRRNVDAPSKARVKLTLEEIILQEEMQMVSRMQEEMVIIKGSQGKKTSELHRGKLLLSSTKVYFLVISILIQTLGTWQKIVGHIAKTNIMVPVNLLEYILQEEVIISYS